MSRDEAAESGTTGIEPSPADPRVAGAVARALAAVGAVKLPVREPSDFYTPPEQIPTEPGTVIRTEKAAFYVDPLRLIKVPAYAERIMYATRDRLDRPIATTGVVLTPTRPRTRRVDRALVGFAVGTQGMGNQCAPSRQLAMGREYESLFIAGLLARGFNVVLPDYQGLGLGEVHTYMSRQVQGQVILDGLRAAQHVGLPDIPVAGPTAIIGYSQGGGAAASAAELAHEYAPELDIHGIVAGAVPADLNLLASRLDGSVYFAFLAYALVGLASDYGLDLAAFLNERGLRMAEQISRQCLFESLRRYPLVRSADLTVDGRAVPELLAESPLTEIVAEQRIGDGRWPRMPVLVSHSRLDDVVPYEAGRALAQRWVEHGARVRLSVNFAPTHAAAAITSYATAFRFLHDRFTGRPMRANTARYLREQAVAE